MMDSQDEEISEDDAPGQVDILTLPRAYAQLQDIPGMPGPVPESQTNLNGDTGALMFESHRRLTELGRSNVPPLTPDFDEPYDDWNSLNGTNTMEHMYPVSEQR